MRDTKKGIKMQSTVRSRVSVIIPTRNRISYLSETLRLLSVQNYPADATEVIVVDDGSEDNTGAVIARACYPFRLVYHRLEGTDDTFWAARPRNAGLRLATGEIIILLDSDIFVNANFISAHVELHTGNGRTSPP